MTEPLEVVSVDLDSTIYDTHHRHHLIDRVRGTDWNAYSAAHINDTPGPAWELVRLFTRMDVPFIIVSGRSESARESTVAKLLADGIEPLYVFLEDERHGGMDHGAWKALRLKEIQDEYNLKVSFHIDDIAAVGVACEAVGIPTMLVYDVKSGFAGFLG